MRASGVLVLACLSMGAPGAAQAAVLDPVFGFLERIQAQDPKILATSIQLELNRLGCGAGMPDGLWGPGSKRALALYGEKTGQSDLGDAPTEALLTQLRSENGQLCTLPPGVVAGEDRSTTAHLEAIKYSYTVWSTMPSRVATEQTDYGVIRCEAGSGSTPRKCSWQ